MRRGAVALVGGWVCLGLCSCGKDSTNPVGPMDNAAPVIVSVTVTPAEVAPGGTASVTITAVDTDGDTMTAAATATHGTVVLGAPVAAAAAAGMTAENRLTWSGTYTATSAGSDAILVVVRDANQASASSSSSPLTVAPPPTTPTPEPTPEPGGGGGGGTPNRAPAVSVGCVPTSCHPTRTGTTVTPCTSTCTATATDADGDTLSYAWTGCASGGSNVATCSVGDLGPFTATAEVSDGKAPAVTSSATVEGTNEIPVSTYTGVTSPPIACGAIFWMTFNYADDDSDANRAETAQVVAGTCTINLTGHYPSWYEVQLTAPAAGKSNCQIRARASDGWVNSNWALSATVTVCGP